MSNLELWNSFGRTDPQYTKAANVDGNKQTSISGNYMVKLATETLGPIGKGWGYRIVEERFDNTKPMMIRGDNGPEMLYDNGSIVWEQTHTILVEMWHTDRSNTFTQYGHTKFKYMKSDLTKVIVDHEYAKKSLTDAMKKCLSLIGVCSDVFMGEFDDVNYQHVAQVENDIKKAEDQDKEIKAKTNDLVEFVKDKINTIHLCPDMQAVGKVYGLAVNRIDKECPILGLNPEIIKQPLDLAYFEQEAKLKEAK